MQRSPIFAYVTAPDHETAVRIGRAIVEDRLAACANVIDGMTSVYRWNDQIEESSEVVLILKSTADLTTSLTEQVRKLHPYDCPCVVTIPIQGGDAEFLEWISQETRSP
ncbi:divalent-cation tolerance protein CutA [Thalassoroseus pseudoceratinae]|uniref:divalent-cation tolerance protein CutA n=1 Tax=Thalassoroseus pseudoceratinae TaxID=2713176 RepID=UPI0014232B80|nr:divalent-cation tolerance protein CutA [Thalassoroseus pseudoceratinae]